VEKCSGPPAAGGPCPWVEGQPLRGLMKQSGDDQALDGWQVLAHLVAAVGELVLMSRGDPRHGGKVDQELGEGCDGIRREGKLTVGHDLAPFPASAAPPRATPGRLIAPEVRYGVSIGRWLGSALASIAMQLDSGVNVSESG
jgi:hypothetical protein